MQLHLKACFASELDCSVKFALPLPVIAVSVHKNGQCLSSRHVHCMDASCRSPLFQAYLTVLAHQTSSIDTWLSAGLHKRYIHVLLVKKQ